MPKEEQPGAKSAASEPNDSRSQDSLSLVDYFDQKDRDAFRRALEYRDRVQPRNSSR